MRPARALLAVDALVDSFAADLHMIAQATGLADRARVLDVVHDIRVMAQFEFLARIDVVLADESGAERRAAAFHLSCDASPWNDDRPGDNLWPHLPDGSLHVVIAQTPAWWMLSGDERLAFAERLCLRRWESSEIDTAHPGLVGRDDRCYVARNRTLERIAFVLA